MTRDFTIRRRLAAIALGAVGIGTAAFAQTAATSRPASASGTEAQPTGEWHNYGPPQHSPLDQIDKTNVHQLEIAWRWKSIDYGLAAQHEGIEHPDDARRPGAGRHRRGGSARSLDRRDPLDLRPLRRRSAQEHGAALQLERRVHAAAVLCRRPPDRLRDFGDGGRIECWTRGRASVAGSTTWSAAT